MSGHTKGPWKLNGFYVDLDGATRIATVSNWRMSGADYYCEAKANAHLIAAAPELLEALELADAMLSGANMNANVVERKVKSAIAKAKGEQLK